MYRLTDEHNVIFLTEEIFLKSFSLHKEMALVIVMTLRMKIKLYFKIKEFFKLINKCKVKFLLINFLQQAFTKNIKF